MANPARAQAETARAEAEFRRDEAEGLIEFMLTDLRQRLDAVGRLDILDSTAERSLAYYAKQDAESLDPDALGRRARAQLLAGAVHNLKGDLDNALAAYEQAAATTGEQLRRDPGNEQRIFDHSQSVFWVGYIAWQRGDTEKARNQLNQYHDHAQKLVEIDPDNDDWQAELEYSYSNLGTLEMAEGDNAAAELYFRKSLQVSSRLAEKYPDDVERILAAGQSYAWWASSLHRQTKLDGAIAARSAEVQLYERALISDAKNNLLKESAVVAHYGIAEIALDLNDLTLALQHVKTAAELASELANADPDNAVYQERLSFSHAILGEVYAYQGQLSEARQVLSTSISIGVPLGTKEENVARWRRNVLAHPKLVLARLEASEGNLAEAESLFTEVADDLGARVKENAADMISMRRYCEALAGKARLSSEATGLWTKIITILEPSKKKHGPEALLLLSEAYIETSQSSNAKTIATNLFEAGFRHPDFVALLKAYPDLLADGSKEHAAGI
jgi:tetratricopeptide (TPR) repeat protein